MKQDSKKKAEKKIQIAIDKMIDLLDIAPGLAYDINGALERLREIESKIYSL